MNIDTHAHIFKEYYKENIDEVINNYEGIIIVNGYDHKTNKEVLKLVSEYKNVYGTLGIHPSCADNYKKEHLDFIKDNINKNKIVGVGEIGLDYYWVKNNNEKQKELFISQIKIANEFKKPIVVHSREAVSDVFDIIKENYNVEKALIHSYTGSLEMAKRFIKIKAKLGINGVVTFKNAKNVKKVVENIDLINLLIETDSPYLTPEPFRGKQNKPEYTKYIANEIAKIKEVSVDSVLKQTYSNAVDIFDIKN